MDSGLLSGILTLISIIGLLLFSMKDNGSKKETLDNKHVQ